MDKAEAESANHRLIGRSRECLANSISRLLYVCQNDNCPTLPSLHIMEKLLRLCSYLLFLVAFPLASALKLDVAAHGGHESASKERCIRNFVAKDQLVVVTAIIDGLRGDGQQLNMHVSLQDLYPFLITIADLASIDS
jgi:hypothetical protein